MQIVISEFMDERAVAQLQQHHDVMYDPNADNAVNNQNWQEVEIVP